MKANELMIGDWVECTYWNPSKQLKVVEIRRIMDDEIKIGVYSDDLVLIFRQSEVKPIPLTPEILEKNGFVVESRHCHGEPLQYCVITDGLWIDISGENFFEGELEYVHELQHTLRLCEIEKEIIL